MHGPHTTRSIAVALLLGNILPGTGTLASGQTAAPPEVSPSSLENASGYHLTATWQPGGGGAGGWDYLAIDPKAGQLYIARQDRLQVVSLGLGRVSGEVEGLDGAHGIAIVPSVGRGFATSGKSNSVMIFELDQLKPVGEPTKVGQKPDAIIYDPASEHVFAFNGGSNDASVLNPNSGTVGNTIALGGRPEFAVADGKGAVFVNLEDKNEVVAIDSMRNKVTHHWSIAPGEGPTGLSMDVDKRRLFVGCGNEELVVLNADSGKVVETFAIGKGVDATAFDPGTKLAFASCGDGTLTVIGEDAQGKLKLVDTIKTQPGARTMALDPKTHDVFLATADDQKFPAPPPGERPKIEPGTFRILKYSR